MKAKKGYKKDKCMDYVFKYLKRYFKLRTCRYGNKKIKSYEFD